MFAAKSSLPSDMWKENWGEKREMETRRVDSQRERVREWRASR